MIFGISPRPILNLPPSYSYSLIVNCHDYSAFLLVAVQLVMTLVATISIIIFAKFSFKFNLEFKLEAAVALNFDPKGVL